MTHHSTVPHPWRSSLLAAAPGALTIAALGARSLGVGHAMQPLLVVLAAAIAVYFVAGVHRARRAPTWALAGIGLALSVLFAAAWDRWFAPPAQPFAPPAGRALLSALLPGIGLAGYAGLLWATYQRAQSEGPAAALLLSAPVTLLAFAIMDPTYGFFLYLDSRAVAAGVEALALAPALVALPVWVLRAGSWRSQTWGLLGLSALSLGLMALAPLITAAARAEQGVLNAPPLSAAILYIVPVRTAIAAFFWALLALAVALTLRAGREWRKTLNIGLTPESPKSRVRSLL